jgi:ribosomal protein S18 acetylase RimI-like enzyme
MTITLSTPAVDELGEVVHTLREWQDDAAPFQLHPGDLGWNWQFGTDALAAAVRIWRQDDRLVAIGLVDSGVMRMTTAPEAAPDPAVAERIAADLHDPAQGVLPAGSASVEAPTGSPVHDALAAHGWRLDDPWTPLRRDLSDPVEEVGLRLEDVSPERVADRIAVHHSAFDSTRFTPERWLATVSGLPYADARSLVGYDEADHPVAMITVWTAGPGRPGIIEPMGVHAEHRGRGHGRAITLAGAAALRELGACSALVATQSSNTGGVAAYVAAGFQPLPQRYDSVRDAD